MTYNELVRALRRLGCELKRQSKGSHEIWQHTKTGNTTVVPRHPGDLPLGTLRAILKGLGLRVEDLGR